MERNLRALMLLFSALVTTAMRRLFPSQAGIRANILIGSRPPEDRVIQTR